MRSVIRSIKAALLTQTLKMSDNIDLGVVATSFTPFLPCEEPTAFKQTNSSHLGRATPCTDLCPDSSTHLEVVPDFLLQESRVFPQSPSELRNTGVDLQQLHRVAVVVPRGRYVLEDTGSPHTRCCYGLSTQKIRLTHRGQRQTKVRGLVFHLNFDLVEESLDLFLLKSIPETTSSRKMLSPVQLIHVCSRHFTHKISR